MKKARFTDKYVAALPYAAEGQYEVHDDIDVGGFGLRVGKRSKSWVIVTRVQGRPTRRILGEWRPNYVPEDENDLTTRVLSLAQARAKARAWKTEIANGKDPSVEQRRGKRLLHDATFGAAAEAYIKDLHKRGLRSAKNVESAVRRDLKPLWRRPLADIRWDDVRAILESKASTPYSAHHAFTYCKAIWNHAIEEETFGVTTSPLDRRKPSKVIAPKRPRSRVLDDHEVKAVWRASCEEGFPYGHVVRLLLVTGQRKSEIALARKGDVRGDVLHVPASRQKSNADHFVPLSTLALEVLGDCPDFKGPYLFSTSFGHSPFKSWSKAKKRLDEACCVLDWRLHDLRRVARTKLAPIAPPHVCEAILAHGPKDQLERTYSLYRWEKEMRDALEQYADVLREIVS